MKLRLQSKRLIKDYIMCALRLTLSESFEMTRFRVELEDRPGVYDVSYVNYKGKCRTSSSYSRDVGEVRLIQTQSYVRVDII